MSDLDGFTADGKKILMPCGRWKGTWVAEVPDSELVWFTSMPFVIDMWPEVFRYAAAQTLLNHQDETRGKLRDNARQWD